MTTRITQTWRTRYDGHEDTTREPGDHTTDEDHRVEAADAEAAEAAEAEKETEATTPRRGRRHVWRTLALLVAAAVMAAGLVDWRHAAHDTTLSLAQQRDAVLIAASSDIAVLNTLDYRHVGDGLTRWAAVTTGTLHDQVGQVSASERKLLADQQKISTGKVVDAAVFSLSGDTATVLASVEVSVQDGTDPSTAPTVKRNRFSASMVEVNGVWLIENLEQVAVNIS